MEFLRSTGALVALPFQSALGLFLLGNRTQPPGDRRRQKGGAGCYVNGARFTDAAEDALVSGETLSNSPQIL